MVRQSIFADGLNRTERNGEMHPVVEHCRGIILFCSEYLFKKMQMTLKVNKNDQNI